MNIPTLQGIIDRRILINFIADPKVVKEIIPEPFAPKLYKGNAVVGICLIRLKNIRPKGFPAMVGISSENGAHRIAVEWIENGELKEGVYIPRRDTSSRINNLSGGRIFPGKHFLAKFDVRESNNSYHVAFNSSDNTSLSIDAEISNEFNPDSIFENLETASEFFKKGSIGYSPDGNKYQGLNLHTFNWKVQALKVLNVHSSFFENEILFPKGSIKFDNALLMTNIQHEWKSVGTKSNCDCIGE